MGANESLKRRTVLLVVGAAVAILGIGAALVALAVARDDGDNGISTQPTTTTPSVISTTGAPPSTAQPSTTSGPTSSQPRTLTSEEASTVVWPSPDDDARFNEPVAAAEAFARGLAGFEAPVIGEYRSGDGRSGEVPIRPLASGPETTVHVRQMSDGYWWVIAATAPDIQIDNPTAATAIDNPLQLSGRARAFEGTVWVGVFRRGDVQPLGEGFVTGSGGEELGPFAGEVRWNNPRGGWGVVMLHTTSGENGQVWEVVAVPVGFIGGD